MAIRETYGPSIVETKQYPELERNVPDWRHLFSNITLKQAEKLNVGSYSTWNGVVGNIMGTHYQVHIRNLPDSVGETFDKDTIFHCSCGRRYCVHEAAVMLDYEKKNGPVIQQEKQYDYNWRIGKLKQNDLIRELHQYQEEDGVEMIPAMPFFEGLNVPSGIVRFDVERAVKQCRTTKYHIKRANTLLETKRDHFKGKLEKSREGRETIKVRYYVPEYGDLLHTNGEIVLGPERIISKNCRHMGFYSDLEEHEEWTKKDFLNEYELVAMYKMWELSLTLNEEDHTDNKAEDFFKSLEEQENHDLFEETTVSDRKPIVELMPKIVIEDGEAKLSFKAGLRGGKMCVVRNLGSFVYCYHRETTYELTKKESLDFGVCDFSPESRKLADFIIRRVGEMNAVNEKMWNKTGRELAITFQQSLSGALLDNFYDAAAGCTAEFTDKTNNVKDERIYVGYTRMHFSLKVEDLLDTRGNFLGVAVSGLIPVLIFGATSNYILNASYLSRMNAEERRVLGPFREVADPSGYFRFQVGQAKLQEFYYRVLPKLLNNPYVRLENECSDLLNQYLPPEPSFTFYLDYVDGMILLKAKVTYEEKTYDLGEPSDNGEYRDEVQENRVERILMKIFDHMASEPGRYFMAPDEERLFTFLRRDTAMLEKYGSVMVSSSLSSIRAKQMPSVNLGVSIKSGLLDLSLTSSELSPSELSEVLESYQQKKKYHRLKNGEFISLEENPQIQQILEVFESMNLVPDEVIRNKVHLPVFRSLYLDRMLEEHEQIVTARDRTFRSLVKGFRTVRDADYDLPSDLEAILRPYQTYGYKWLRTLAASGFGGILADEMGLGKTLQMISVFDSLKREGGKKPNLVICPASLVYNWEEEISRFAPDLKVLPLASGTAARKKQLKQLQEGSEISDVYVTSYDLLKRDITLYEGIEFGCCVLDEAQFIKNQKTNAAKAVKVIQSSYRFALTGTPIENRLSEMWSIFDFLMPGFLYSAKEFASRFETPIVKSHDERATEKLKAMVSPFILRRKKEDVLTDLPPKLEEVRYALMSGQQAKLYNAEVQRMKEMLKTSNSPEERFKVFAELIRIREICCDPSLLFEDYDAESTKREACMDLIQSAIDGGHRMLVFSQFTSMLALLEHDLKEAGIPYYLLTGETSKAKRLQLVHSFNEEGDVPVFLISLKAGGTGLNLTGADVVIHYDPWWNLAATNQATDRAHRIGQDKQVTVYKMIVKGTIEEKILDLQNAKQDLAEAVLAGSADSLMRLTPEELLELLS